MTGPFHHVPLDDPDLDRFVAAHELDRDPDTTLMAIGIFKDARAAGHPDDRSAAARVLTGASGAAHVQAMIQRYVNEAIKHDKAAEEHSTEAVQWAQDAQEAAERRRDLPNGAVQLSDGSAQTRRQVHRGHDQLHRAIAQREGRGDFEHNATPPGLAIRLMIVTVLSLIEVFLLIWPITDASWADPKSVGYVASLVVLFLFMNEQLPKLAGLAVRGAREAVHAAWELTHVGLSAGRGGDPGTGREATGQVDERLVRAAERRKTIRCSVLGAVLAIYSAVMFTRVERLAAGLDWPLPFVLLAAGLITVFTAGSVLIMAWWWSRGNALGDQFREHGAITSESRAIAENLADQFRAHARSSGHAADQAHKQLDLSKQALHNGKQTIGRGLQKAAKTLDQESVLTPKPENLFAVGRPIRDRAINKIDRAKTILAEAQQTLAESLPFEPAGPAPNPWEARTAPRQALANPAFVDPYQLGVLHTPAHPQTLWSRNSRVLTATVLVTLAALAAVVLLAHFQ